MSKIDELVESEGFDSLEEFLDEFGSDSVVPGICMNDGCDYTTNVEPDCSRGWCENCNTQTLKSAMVILGVI